MDHLHERFSQVATDMKRYLLPLRTLLVAGSLLVTTGCGSDFVNLVPPEALPVTEFYRTENDIRSAVTGAYGNLRSIYNTFWQYTELPSDNTQTFGESEGIFGAFDKLTWLPSTGAVAGAWNDGYRTIAHCNVVLDKINAVPMTETTKNQYIGELKFIRALMYFNLVRLYGEVPIVLKEITSEAEAYSFVRKPVAEVYAQIEKDLLEAEPVLPAKHAGANIGRVTSGAVQSLLGKAYLQQEKWSQAETILAKVVGAGTYRILPSATDVFGAGKDNNDEIVFAVQYVSGGFNEGNVFAHTFAPQPSTVIRLTGSSYNVGTRDLYDAFETGDLRRDIYGGVFTSGAFFYYWAKKFVDPSISLLNEGSNDWPVLRYADVLLMYAEALNNREKTTLALAQLTDIRKRAGLAPLTGLTQAATQLAIERERRVELCFEGHRWHDLIRWKKEVPTMAAFREKYRAVDPTIANISISETKKLLPVPFRELSLNPNLTQNLGY